MVIKVLSRTMIIIFLLGILIFSITDLEKSTQKKKTSEPVSTDEVVLTNIAEQRIVDVTKVINAKEFIALRDFIVSEGEMQWLSNRFGQIPIISYPLNEDYAASFTVYEADRLRLQSDLIHVLNFRDTIGCNEYKIHYYPNGFSGTIAASDVGLIPHISDYIEGHVYLVVYCDTGITDEQLMRQISSYYSLLL